MSIRRMDACGIPSLNRGNGPVPEGTLLLYVDTGQAPALLTS